MRGGEGEGRGVKQSYEREEVWWMNGWVSGLVGEDITDKSVCVLP